MTALRLNRRRNIFCKIDFTLLLSLYVLLLFGAFGNSQHVVRAPQYLTVIEPSREAMAGMQAVVTKVRNFISALDPETYASKNVTTLSLVIGGFEFAFIFKEDTFQPMTRSLLTVPSREDLMNQAMFLLAEFLDRGICAVSKIAIFVYKVNVLVMVVSLLHMVGFQIRPAALSNQAWNIIN